MLLLREGSVEAQLAAKLRERTELLANIDSKVDHTDRKLVTRTAEGFPVAILRDGHGINSIKYLADPRVDFCEAFNRMNLPPAGMIDLQGQVSARPIDSDVELDKLLAEVAAGKGVSA